MNLNKIIIETLEWLLRLLKLQDKIGDVVIKDHELNYKILQIAASQIGVKEWSDGSNPRVEEYLKYSTADNKSDGLKDNVYWCAAFVCWALEQAGRSSTNSLRARSFEVWGFSARTNPLPGDIVIFWRGSLAAGTGHVGFFVGFKNGNILVLGGNQNDMVNVTEFSTSKITDIRRSTKAPKYTAEELLKLNELAQQIIAGQPISAEGSVT